MRQPLYTGLIVTTAVLCGIVLFVVLLTVMERSTVLLPSAATVTLSGPPRNSSAPPMPQTTMAPLADELSTPPEITYLQSLPTPQPGVQAPMTISAINHVRVRSSWIT